MRLPFASDPDRRLAELMTATRFFTRLPLRPAEPAEEGALARAAWAFPVVGAGVGIACAIVYAAGALKLPGLAAAFLAVGAGILITGALHEDGLADTADGLGGADAEAKLAIMRDSRCGVFGILALVFSVGLRVAALDAFAETYAGFAAVLGALVAAHAVGRGVLPAVMHLVAPARSEGLGAAAGRPETGEAAAAAAIAAIIALVGLGLAAGIAALVAAALVTAAIAWLAQRQIGGYTGDILGAIEQGGETAMLLAAASWAT